MGCFEYTQMIFYWCAFDQKEQKVMGKGQMMRKRQQIKQKDKKNPSAFHNRHPVARDNFLEEALECIK